MGWPGAHFGALPARARAWVEASVGRRAHVLRARQLRGGTASAVHAVDVGTPSGRVLRLVLRRNVRLTWLMEEPDLAEKEARNLQLLERSAIPAPRLVAVDPNGADCDVPAVLMTRMPGRLVLQPADIEPWLRRMAELLPPIHAFDPGSVLVQKWVLWDDLRLCQPPGWSRRVRDWERLIEIVRGPWPAYEPRFVHRDFQHYNVLWSRGRPTAVLDWVNASMGPVELDFGHFRRNLVADFGFEVAERFLHLYREVVGAEPDPFWEALNLTPEWAKTEQQRRELDAYVGSLVAKIG
ncbi:MAG: aminoglycoside phosphotransferase family protein [Chloroflexi bacterium]|nr:MAG: aminoglycoside phosphotransferase family protein [Chloroflexota bacterium]